jgi:hypothetical protein
MEPSFWAVWKDGMDYPSLYPVEDKAKEAVRRMAKQYPGQTVYFLRLAVSGSLTLPEKYKATGQMNGE